MKEKTVALNSIGGKKEGLFLWRICRMKADRKNREPSRRGQRQARENQELKEVHSVIKSMHLTSVQGARVKLKAPFYCVEWYSRMEHRVVLHMCVFSPP